MNETIPVPATPIDSSSRRVLVVDDDDAIRMLVTRLFLRNGFEVTNAADGQEALERLSEKAFDLVILDVMMPRMDGISVAEKISSFPAPRPRVVVMTAAVPGIIERLKPHQVWKVISKPFNLELLLKEALAALAEPSVASPPSAPGKVAEPTA